MSHWSNEPRECEEKTTGSGKVYGGNIVEMNGEASATSLGDATGSRYSGTSTRRSSESAQSADEGHNDKMEERKGEKGANDEELSSEAPNAEKEDDAQRRPDSRLQRSRSSSADSTKSYSSKSSTSSLSQS